MIRFFQIGAAKPRPTIQALRRADKPAHAAFSPPLPTLTTTRAAQPATQENPTMETVVPAQTAPTAPARVFPQIRLGAAGPVESAVIERHVLASEDRRLQGLAVHCANALTRLAKQGAQASFLSQAIEETLGTDVTPEEWLASTLKAIESEIEATKQEHARHEVRHKARSARLGPLRAAVSARLTAAEVEIPRLAEKVRSAELHPFGNQAANQYQKLVDAGLKPEQIALVGTENPVSRIAAEAEAAKARIEVLQAELPALWAFSRDPRSNPDHLNGLEGFDALIAAAQNVVEEGAIQ